MRRCHKCHIADHITEIFWLIFCFSCTLNSRFLLRFFGNNIFIQIIYKTFLAYIVEFKYLSAWNSFLSCWRGGGNFFFSSSKRALPIYPWPLFAWQNNVIFEWIIQLIVCCCFFVCAQSLAHTNAPPTLHHR